MALPIVKRWLGNRRMPRAARNRLMAAKCGTPKFFRPMLELLEDRTLLSAVSWTSTQSGFWDVGSNWSTGQAPTAADDVTINQSGVTVTIRSGNQAVNSLTSQDALAITGGSLTVGAASQLNAGLALIGGQLNVNASLSLGGNSQWNSANLSIASGVTLTNDAAGVLSIDTSNGNLLLNGGGTLENKGQVNAAGAASQSVGNLVILDGSTFSNDAGASYAFSGDGALEGGNGGGTFDNTGTLVKSGGTGESVVTGLAFNNPGGTIQADSGTLAFHDNSGASTSGTFVAQTGATIQLGNDSIGTLTGAYTGSGSGTVLLASGDGISSLTIGSGGATFNLPGTLLQWASGSLVVSSGATLVNGGVLTIDTTNANVVLNGGGTLENKGQVNQPGGNLALSSGSTLSNDAGATYTLSGDVGLTNGNGNGTFVNAGTLLKSQGSANGSSSISSFFTNAGGTIHVAAGNLVMSPAGGNGYQGGTFIVDQGAVFDPAGSGNVPVSGTITGSGAGLVSLSGTLQGGSGGGTLDFPDGLFQATTFGFSPALDGGSSGLTNAGFISLVNTSMTFRGLVNNKGTLRLGSGNLGLFAGCTLANEAGGTFDFQGDGSVTGVSSGGGTGVFVNAGSILKPGGSGTSQLLTTFENPGGTIDVESGTLAVSALNGGTSTGNANFVAAPGATLVLYDGGTVNSVFPGNYNLSGGGTFVFDLSFTGFGSDTTLTAGAGTTVDLSGTSAQTAAGIAFAVAAGAILDLGTGTFSGSFTGAGTVNFSSMNLGIGGVLADVGDFDWTGGNINGALGDLTNRGTMTISGSGEHIFFQDGTLDNFGTIVQTGTGNLGLHSDSVSPTTLKNEAGAVYDIEADSGFDNPFGGTTAVINDGTIEKTGGTGTSTLLANGTFSNTGTIEADSGTLAVSATIPQIVGTTLASGTWNALNGANLALPGGTNITTNQANVTVDGNGTSITGIGNLAVNSGDLSLTNGATLTTAGDFSNSGSLLVGAGSTLAVTGGYTQSSTGTVQFQLGGAPSSGKFGQLTATGAASLNGTLGVSLTNSYSPSANDSFQVMTYPSETGSFSTNNLPLFRGGDLFGVQTNTGNVTVSAPTSTADLKVSSVTTTATSVQTGQNLTVNYTAQNAGNATPSTSWVDSIFLSASGVLDSSSILLGRVNQTGPVAANGTYNGTLTAVLPSMLPGNYTVIVEADSRGLVPDSNRANNVLAATTPVQVSVPSLTLGTPTNVTVAPGQQAVFQLTLPAGADVQISAAGTSTLGSLLVGYKSIPTLDNNIGQAINADPATATLHSTQAGTYFVVYQLDPSAAGPVNLTLNAQTLGFQITSVTPNVFTFDPLTFNFSHGNITLTVSGDGFTPATTVSLKGELSGNQNGSVQAESVSFQNSHTLFATFALDQLGQILPPGNLFAGPGAASFGELVQASDHGVTVNGQQISLTFVPDVNAHFGGQLFGQIAAPSAVRVGRPYTVQIYYGNEGNTNIPAPLLELSGQGAEFQLPGQSGFTPNSILLFAGNPNGPGGVLPPGFGINADGPQATGIFEPSQSITVTVIPTTSGQINLQLGEADPSAPIPLSSLESILQPPSTPPAAWNAIFSNFTSAVGSTMGGLQSAFDNDANYLSQIGEYTSDPTQLLAFQIEQADDFGAITQRNTPGIFGLGIPNPTITAVTDAQGNVNLISGSTVRPFTLTPVGSYQGVPGDFATLTLTNGVYQLRETDGTLEVFNANGSLNFIKNTKGNKLVYGYTGNQLTSITNTLNGDVTTFTYNAQGLVSQITDPEGRNTKLSYDSAGHLLSIVNPQGTTSYTYVSSGTPQQLNALASITNPDGSQVNFSYNNQGQLVSQSQNGGANPLTFSYNVGAITTTDALNDKTTELFDEVGQVAEQIDPLGNITHVGYNSDLEATSLGVPGGLTGTAAFNTLGNPISAIDPLGQQTTATYNPTFNVPQTITNPLGDSVNYSYDPTTGSLLGITYPDGSSQQYEYNALGQVAQLTNRNGQAIAYTYYSNGLLKSETFPDGSQDTFTYDNHRNMVAMTDSTGTTTFAYDSADRLTKVTYTDGSFLAYTYNALGQRIQMTDQTGYTVNYQYDALGRLSKLTDANSNLIVSYNYDASGRVSSKQFGNGDVCNYTYDADGNVLSIVNLAPDQKTVQSSYVYTYNSQNLPITMTTSTGTFTYGYDADGQLTSVKTPNGETITYQYDAAGNRIAVVDNNTTTNYTTNNLNEYTQVGNTTYQYDANGDLISSTNSSGITTYQYNALGQLVSVVSSTGTTTYQYNALGEKVSEDVNGTVTNLLIDPIGLGNVVGQFAASGDPVAQYAYGLGLVSQTAASGSNNFYSFDLTGNTTQLTGATGSVLDAYSYLPFGEQLSASGSTPNPFTYVGQFGVMNDAGGLDFMRNRWYNPNLGRFVSPDPTGDVGGDTNLYRYVFNSPLASIDATGLDRQSPGITLNQVQPGVAQMQVTIVNSGTVYTNAPPPGGGTIDVGGTAGFGPAVTGGLQFNPVNGDLFVYGGVGNSTPTASVSLQVSTSAPSEGSSLEITGSVFNATGSVSITQSSTSYEGGATVGIGPPASAGIFFVTEKKVGNFGETLGFQPVPIGPPKLLFVHTSHDPNEITGPGGFGTQGFIPANSTLPYRIDFTNEASATAPADVVVVTQQLDPSLDLSTFQLGDLGFGNTIIQVPAGLTSYSTTVNLPSTAPGAGPNGLEVEINASLNSKTGLVTWTFTSIDPTTQDIPIDPSEGFLPPDVTAPEGEGFVSYTIQPKSTITTSTAINAQATVVFDQNAPINTAQISNTLDPAAPTSSVNPLPATTTSPKFNVSWSGHDDSGGSGIASFNVFVSDNGGAFTPLLTNTTQTSTTFTGKVGHSYSFFSVATDNVGNVQPLPTTAQATTTVTLAPPPPPPVSPPPHPPAPPTLQVPPLLAFFDSLLGGVEKVNGNGTETITDSFFGIPLLVSTFDSSGKLVSVDLLGFLNITFLFG